MVFYATFNNISAILWWPVLLVEETGEPGEHYRPVASPDKLYHIILYRTGFELTTLVVIDTDYTSSCKSNYHLIMIWNNQDVFHSIYIFLFYCFDVKLGNYIFRPVINFDFFSKLRFY